MRSSGLPLVVAAVLAAVFVSSSVAQQPTGPATIENVLASDEAPKPPAAPEAKAADADAVRPSGTLVRPKDGVQHPALDKAWAEYDAAVTKTAESVRAALAKQFAAATAKGDLDAAEKWQKAIERFEEAGEVPAETDTKDSIKRANNELIKAYTAVEKDFTVEKKLNEARATRDEANALTPKPPVFLSDLAARNVKVGFGVMGLNGDLGFEGRRAVVGGVPQKKCISLCPPSKGFSRAVFDVPVGYTHFEVVAAINDPVLDHQVTPVTFKVLSEKGVLWTSQPLIGGGNAERCSVALKGSKTITLMVECPGPHNWAHAVWCDPKVIAK